MDLYIVHHWQFITQEFAPATEPMSEADAWAYVRAQVASGKDMSRFRIVEAMDAEAAAWVASIEQRVNGRTAA